MNIIVTLTCTVLVNIFLHFASATCAYIHVHVVQVVKTVGASIVLYNEGAGVYVEAN